MKFIVAEIQRSIDRLERLEINIDLSFFALGCDDFTAVDDQAIRRNLGVELQPLLGRGDGGQDGLAIDARFNVGSGALR